MANESPGIRWATRDFDLGKGEVIKVYRDQSILDKSAAEIHRSRPLRKDFGETVSSPECHP